MQVHRVYRLYEVHVYVHEGEKKRRKRDTCVLTYTYSVRSLFCGEERRFARTRQFILCGGEENNAQRFDQQEGIVCYFLKGLSCNRTRFIGKLIFMCLYATSMLNSTLYFNSEHSN